MNLDNLSNDYFGLIAFIVSGGFLLGLILQYFFLKNLSDLLKAVRPPNRGMQPAQVWLLLLSLLNYGLAFLVTLSDFVQSRFWIYIVARYAISLFVIIWQFRIVHKVAASIEAEYDSRKIPIEHRPSYQTGMFMAAANAASLLKDVPGIGFLGSVAGLAYLIGWISYWVRTHKYKKELQAMPEYMDEEESLIFSGLK